MNLSRFNYLFHQKNKKIEETDGYLIKCGEFCYHIDDCATALSVTFERIEMATSLLLIILAFYVHITQHYLLRGGLYPKQEKKRIPLTIIQTEAW